MNVSDLVHELEARFRCVDGPYRACCQTGEEYVKFSIIAQTEDVACQAALAAIMDYADKWRHVHPGRHPVLYWRFAKECRILWHWDKKKGRGNLYSRLVLSDRPVVEESDEAYDARRTADLERQHFGEPNGQQAGQPHLPS